MDTKHILDIRARLFTKSIEDKLPKLEATKEVSLIDKNIIARYYFLDGSVEMFVFEGEHIRSDDVMFYGAFQCNDAHNDDNIGTGYFILSTLCVIRDSFNLPLQLDGKYTQERWHDDYRRLHLDKL